MEINTNIGIGFSRQERNSKAPTLESILEKRGTGLAKKNESTEQSDPAKIGSQLPTNGKSLPTAVDAQGLSHALQMVSNNLERKPDNRGLENAISRIERNIAKYQDTANDTGNSTGSIETAA